MKNSLKTEVGFVLECDNLYWGATYSDVASTSWGWTDLASALILKEASRPEDFVSPGCYQLDKVKAGKLRKVSRTLSLHDVTWL